MRTNWFSKKFRQAFTLVEILTVIAIIVLIMTITFPALDKARQVAMDTKQRSEMHNLEIALELYRADFDDYPESSVLDSLGAGSIVCGAQCLAEAVVGRDLKGFDPLTTWYAAQEEVNGETEIYANVDKGSTDEEIEDSLNRRRGPYYKIEDSGAYLIEQIYGNYESATSSYTYSGAIYSASEDHAYQAPVISDVYHQKKIIMESGRSMWCGSPVLYFKANTVLAMSNQATMLDANDPGASVYNIYDNLDLIEMGSIEGETIMNHFDSGYVDEMGKDGIEVFYETIRNEDVSTYKKPYNADSFILISAGDDAIYGTRDDITNFRR